MMYKIGILHPGEMGVSIAASAVHSGHEVYWLSKDRSEKTKARAETHGLRAIDTLYQFCETCEIILSVCPPHAAEDLARAVSEAGYHGLYLDANAISPQRINRIGMMLAENDIQFVDGCIIGGPAWKPNETWLYLSGNRADKIVECFSDGPVETKIVGHETGKASALKMCYAAYTKGTTALLATILAAAESLAVREELYAQWERDEQGFSDVVNQRVRRVTAKAWRFEGEMEEIAATFREAGLPDGFHLAAAEIYHQMADLKDAEQSPSLQDVLQAIRPK